MAQTAQDPRLAFIVDYDDPHAGLTRQYRLLYFLNDRTVEMVDAATRRVFLKRCACPTVAVDDLFLGATLTVLSRQLRVTAYADDHTKSTLESKSETTLAIITPDGYDRMGEILKAIQKEGLRVKDVHTVRLTPEEAAPLFRSQEALPHSRDLLQFVTSAPVVALHLVGDDCIGRWSRLLGPIDPDQAKQTAPQSLRARYGSSVLRNVAHGAEDPRAAAQDLPAVFGPDSPIRARNSAVLTDCTLGIIKPHAVAQGLASDIVQAILDARLEITALMVAHLSTVDAEDFLEVYKGVVPEYRAMVDQLTSGPCWAIALHGDGVQQAFRTLCGPHEPEIARALRPHSLRARHGVDKVCNAVHCTDLPEDSGLEVEFFFRLLPPKAP